MSNPTKRQSQAKTLRIFRKAHRYTGAALFVFFFVVAITGLLLGWKKNSGNIILSKSYQGTSTDLKDWLPIDSLYQNACKILRDSVAKDLSSKIDRIDIRKDKGMVKFVYAEHFIGIQLDGATGKLLHIEARRADYIEKIHDGSLVDFYFKSSSGWFKLLYTTVMGIALLVFTITGFWLWYGPKRMKN